MKDPREEVREPDLSIDTELDLVIVRQYDTNDILQTVQCFALVREENDESSEGSFILSSVAEPAEPAQST